MKRWIKTAYAGEYTCGQYIARNMAYLNVLNGNTWSEKSLGHKDTWALIHKNPETNNEMMIMYNFKTGKSAKEYAEKHFKI